MASNIGGTGTSGGGSFGILGGEVLPPKGNENKLITSSTANRADDLGEDDVFANENESPRSAHSHSADISAKPSKVSTVSVVGVSQISSSTSSPASIPYPIQDSVPPVTSVNHAAAAGTSIAVTVPTTTRRPSYTSKAPSALTNLPKIDDITTSPSNIQTFTLNPTAIIEKRSSLSGFDNDDNGRPGHKDLLSLHGQASFDSIDHEEYSNPGTPTSSSLASGHLLAARNKDKANRMRADLLSKGKWEMAAKANILTVRCREEVAELHKDKFGSGSKGKCIKFGDKWCTPIEFEGLAGRASCKDWKRSIRFHGLHLQKLIEDQFLTLHAISCTCGICCGDETLTGPVKLFQSVKRKRSHIGSTLGSSPGPYKRKSFSDEYKQAFRERGASLSVEGDVFTLGHDDPGMPPMTPLTPITPLTPHTPFGANCLTPLPVGVVRPTSPPKSIMLQVPVSSTSAGSTIAIPVKEMIHQQTIQHHQLAPMIPPPTPPKPDINMLNQLTAQPWNQLEEMASALVIMANKFKLIIEQTKIQAEALKDSAVTQAKIQAENEKAEIRRAHFQHGAVQLISLPNGDPTTQITVHQQLPKCNNCGRDASQTCRGCNKSHYCGTFCQQKDWILHRNRCGRIEHAMVPDEHATQVVTSQNATHLTIPGDK